MSWRCAYGLCKENHKVRSGSLSYHKFPLDNSDLLSKWLQAMGQPDFRPSRYQTLCSAHFLASDFRAGRQQCVLHEGAVPSQFQHNTGCTQEVPQHSGCADTASQEKPTPPPGSGDIPYAAISLPTVQQPSTSHQNSAVKHDHTYSREITEDRVKLLEEGLTSARKKLKVLHEKTTRYEKKSGTLLNVIEEMKAKNLISQEAEKKLEEFQNLPQEILKGWGENAAAEHSCRRRYNDEMKKFSSTLYYYSPRAYEYLGRLFPMPSAQAIRKWLQVVSGWPGFTAEVLNDLKVKHGQDSPRERLCSILLDGMSIRKACELDASSGRLIGYVDLGHSPENEDVNDAPLATEALVFMVVGIAAPWKMPFGYFLNAGLSGEVVKNLLLDAIHCITECGLTVVAVVCDCLSANVSMAKLLGCQVHEHSYKDLKTFFPHPENQHQKIFMLFDACHGIKLLRNLLGDKGVLVSSFYGTVRWEHIVCLHELQDKEGLRAANKLSRAHIEYYRQVMKVKLAAQVFSSSVSKALEFASRLQLPDFEDCSGTAKFIAMVDRTFDHLNSCNPTAKGFKAPLRPSTLQYQGEVMEVAGKQLMDLRLPDGTPVAQDGRRMSVIALAFTLKSVSQLAKTLFDAELCRYICTRRLTQDPLEMYFSCIRQRGGWNNNPSPAQFRHAYRSTIVHAAVVASRNCNVSTELEGISLSRSQRQQIRPCMEDSCYGFQLPTSTLPQLLLDHDYFALSEFKSKVVEYIGGYVVRAISSTLHCAECAALLVSDSISSLLTLIKNQGGLIEPSRFVHAAMHAAERMLQQTPAVEKHNVTELTLKAFREFVQQHKAILEECAHYTEDPHHVITLTRVVQKKYIRLRLREIARRVTEKNRGAYVRHQFTKRVLFAHQ